MEKEARRKSTISQESTTAKAQTGRMWRAWRLKPGWREVLQPPNKVLLDQEVPLAPCFGGCFHHEPQFSHLWSMGSDTNLTGCLREWLGTSPVNWKSYTEIFKCAFIISPCCTVTSHTCLGSGWSTSLWGSPIKALKHWMIWQQTPEMLHTKGSWGTSGWCHATHQSMIPVLMVGV